MTHISDTAGSRRLLFSGLLFSCTTAVSAVVLWFTKDQEPPLSGLLFPVQRCFDSTKTKNHCSQSSGTRTEHPRRRKDSEHTAVPRPTASMNFLTEQSPTRSHSAMGNATVILDRTVVRIFPPDFAAAGSASTQINDCSISAGLEPNGPWPL